MAIDDDIVRVSLNEETKEVTISICIQFDIEIDQELLQDGGVHNCVSAVKQRMEQECKMLLYPDLLKKLMFIQSNKPAGALQ